MSERTSPGPVTGIGEWVRRRTDELAPSPVPWAALERRHRRGVVRRASLAVAGVVAVVLVAGTVAALTGDDRTALLPAVPTPTGPLPSSGCEDEKVTKADAGPVLRLPDRAPFGLPWGVPYIDQDFGRCGGYLQLTAWTEDPGTHQVTRWVEISSSPWQDELGTGCDRFDGGGQMPGTCRTLRVAGRPQQVLWVAPPEPQVRWVERGRLWTIFTHGFDASTLEAAVRDLRLDDDGRVDPGSLPRGMDVLQSPEETDSGRVLSIWWGTDPQQPESVIFAVQDSPLADPFAALREMPFATAGARMTVVDVGGRAGYWYEDEVRDEPQLHYPKRVLRWRGDDGVTMSLEGDRLTLPEAMAVATSVRKVSPDDTRLVTPPPRTN